ncbi:hypothetical protein OU787_20305 [Kitasatospora sp. YST-16]|uniref:hypothetical protein n=1 Tax=Kitasatospora sp. YST-16 TaxID=2998080 RepID=UPI002283F36B|nr:hypothetical protein [Kitasatospora sp. YST-16]WAL73651.1 hypothetical protein OU787_20305 [Kitasatospora sp. YST-16]WNW39709.1 hypothetical protein RKE32_20250 [Streptomyces sp. Li-HN-5-13]
MADETTTAAVPEAEQTPAPVEHIAAAADPNAIEHALEVLAEGQPAAPVVKSIEPGDDETFEPLGVIGNCP